MNKNLFDFLINKIDTITIDELEEDLRAFGIDCERKVEIFSTESLLNFPVEFEGTEFLRSLVLPLTELEFTSANDNSYALAA
jgi:hypothetical protein